jgi:RNase P/RNase MRP subunit p29
VSSRRWKREMKRYRIIEHEHRGESVFIVEWNDRWFLGLWGRWHGKFQTLKIEDAVNKIHRLVSLKTKINLDNSK